MKVNSVFAYAHDGATHLKVFTDDRRIVMKKGFDPYCFVRMEDLWGIDPAWGTWNQNGETDYKFIDMERNAGVNMRGELVAKLTFQAPKCVKNFRDLANAAGIEVYESDVPYRRRWLYETHPEIGGYKACSWDIETDSRLGFVDPHRNTTELPRILSISGTGSDGKDLTYADNDEKQLITGFFDEARKRYGVLVGWNTEFYDEPYVRQRARDLGLWDPFQGLETFDLIKVYKRVKSPESSKLNVVANIELGIGKREEFMSREHSRLLWDSFVSDKAKLLDYNLQDARLVKLIDAKYRFVEGHEIVADTVHVAIGDALYAGRVVDAAVLSTALQLNPRIVFPPKRSWSAEENVEEVKGGQVFDPIPGVYKDMAYIDFKSMYPSIIRAFNISPETVDESGACQTAVLRFKPEPQGVFVKALERLLEKRMYTRKMNKETHSVLWKSRDDFIKQLVNAFYGVIASPYSRFYDEKLANSVTLTGQMFIKHLAQYFKERGHSVIYGDTDSLFMSANGLKPQELEKIATDHMREAVKARGAVNPNVFDVECAYIFSGFIMTDAKKRYYGRAQWVEHEQAPKEVIVGFEMKKKNVLDLTKEVQKELFSIAIDAPNETEALRKTATRLAEVYEEMKEGKHDQKLVLRLHMMKPLDGYEHDPMHARAARLLPEELSLSPGDVVSYTIVDVDDMGKPVVVPVLDQMPGIEPGGYEYMYRHYIASMARRLFTNLDLDNDGQMALEEFDW